MIIKLVLGQIASEYLDIEIVHEVWIETKVNIKPGKFHKCTGISLWMYRNKPKIQISKDRDSLIEQSNALIEQSLHATERIMSVYPQEANMFLAW